jgi:hypothetical protein
MLVGMKLLIPVLLTACGLDSFNTNNGNSPGTSGTDSGLHGLDSGQDANQPPEAQAGIDQELYVQNIAELDGGFSFDPDGDPLDFQWRVDAAPSGSTSNLINGNNELAELYLDVEGLYEISLEVSDGAATDTDSMTLLAEAPNQPPTADAGADQSVPVAASVQLSGANSSDPDGDPLTYEWRLKSLPNGSAATLATTSGGLAGFIADKQGNYLIDLIVHDGVDASAQDTVKVTATEDSSGGSSCNCGERIEHEARTNPWLFGIVLVPQGYLGPLLLGFWARRRRRDGEPSVLEERQESKKRI